MQSPRSYAPVWAKRLVWNWKHADLRIDPLGSPLVAFLAPRIPVNASLLDLGCGAGNLRAGLRSLGWDGNYTGVDISEKTLSVARRINDPKAEWFISPIETFVVEKDYDIICLVESIYYVRLKCIPELLRRCSERCRTIYVRIWDTQTHAPYVRELGTCSRPSPDLFVIECKNLSRGVINSV